MQLIRSGRWLRQGLTMSLGALLLALCSGAAVARMPVKARLSIAGPNSALTQYPAVRLPDGSIADYRYDSCNIVPALGFKLEVWYAAKGAPEDVTQSPNSSFSSKPDRMAFANIAVLDLSDGINETKVKFRGSYTEDGVTVEDNIKVEMKLFQAPGFYNAGGSQQSLLQEIDALALAMSAYSWSGDPGLQYYLEQIRMFVRLWWSGRLAIPVAEFGNIVVDLGAPPELLTQLSQFVLNLRNAGLLNVSTGADGTTTLSLTQQYPPWLPPPASIAAQCGPITVSWYGIAR